MANLDRPSAFSAGAGHNLSVASAAAAAPSKKSLIVPVSGVEDYEISKPIEMELFQARLAEEAHFSNIVYPYDLCPKYVYWTRDLYETSSIPIARTFNSKGIRYSLEIKPAIISDQHGRIRAYYPGLAEELLEDTLRKLAVDGQGCFLGDRAGVFFTLYQVQKHLSKFHRTWSVDQIKKALAVCAGTNIRLTDHYGNTVFNGPIFETVGLTTKEDLKRHGKTLQCFVRFSAPVTDSVRSGSWRRIDYVTCMSLKKAIARAFYKRMTYNFTQADSTKKFRINVSTLLNDAGVRLYEPISDSIRYVYKALLQMKDQGFLWTVEIDRKYEPKRPNKLKDAELLVLPSFPHVATVIAANTKHREVLAALGFGLRR